MISLLFLILPIVFALLTLLGPEKHAAKIGFVLSHVTLLLSAYGYYEYMYVGHDQFVFDINWLHHPLSKFKLTIDGISLLLIILVNICMPYILLSVAKKELKNKKAFIFSLFLSQFALMGVFLADDLLLYYIFWELSILPAYFLLIYWGGENKVKITVKFFLYTILGSLFMLVAIIYLYANFNQIPLDSQSVFDLSIKSSNQKWLFWGFMIAYAIKLPLIPLHTWQADTYKMAPSQATMILSGLMAKMALFSLVRWLMPLFPDAVIEYGPIIAIVAVVGVIYGSVVAIMQSEMKRMFAFASLAHISLMVAGIFSLTRNGIEGAFIQAFSHGINTIGLFVCADIIYNRLGTTEFVPLGGIRKIAPRFTTVLFVMMFAVVALPFTNSFIGELVVLFGIFDYSPILACIAVFSLVLGAVYMLRMFRRVILGPPRPETANFRDLYTSEKIVLYPMVLMIFVFGIVYQPFFDLTNDTVTRILRDILIR